MSVPVGHTQNQTQTTYRTISVSSEPTAMGVGGTVISGQQLSQLPYSFDGGSHGTYDSVRYLVPVSQAMQHQQSYVMMPQVMPQMVSQVMPQMVSQVMPQMVSPVYLQSLPRISVSSQEDCDVVTRQHNVIESVSGRSSVFSHLSSPIKSPEPSAEEVLEDEEEEEEEEEELELNEVEIVTTIEQKPAERVEGRVQKVSRVEVQREVRETLPPPQTKMDTRFFGELLAEVYRKNCDIHSCIAEHVAKIGGRKHRLDSSNDYKLEKEEVESLIPRGASELTKQQIRYLLQTRLTADKSMRLLLSTFSSLREELIHMSDDLRRLEGEKESLERDLSFKADQAQQYDSLLEAVRENNRQLQVSLKTTGSSQRSLEAQLLSSRSSDSERDFRLKELESQQRALEQENDLLRQKLAGQGSSSASLQVKTEELSRRFREELSALQQEKERELQGLRTQLTRFQTELSTERSSSDRSQQLRITELSSTLEQRQKTIRHLEQEIQKLRLEMSDTSRNVTKTVITKKYRNQYPILGLLGDDYLMTSPIKEAKTIVIEKSGGIIKQEIITTP